MSDSFNVRVDNLPGFREAMRQGPKTLQAEMVVAARRIGKRGEALAHVYVKRRDGHLAGTIFGDGAPSGDGAVAIFGATADYAIFVEKGRGAGKPMPPAGALLPWMASVGIPESAEYAVRRKIGRDGIAPAPFVGRAHKEMKSAGFYRKEFGDAVRRALARIRGGG